MGEDRRENEKQCLECCNRNCREKCYDECCCPKDRCDEGGSGIWLIILIIVIYLLFCNDNNGKGGFLGGLF